ncbi:hypothetical protein GOBAR_DD00846 [Gossypium barbadense]|nr:hypothetical protein GOBAR_DD00846 [Gossypium barbadense]
MEKKGTVLMQRFEVGRLLGQGTFAKVYQARNLRTGESCAIKTIDKEKIMKGGGELFNKIAKGKLKEDDARRYFQQLIAAVDYCHSRGVYHRDLKPENLLLDENGNLKVSDFGLSAFIESSRQDGLLHTTCGTPAYVAPEVIHHKGYDGAKADIWSCGVILYALLAGFLPFQHSNLMELYRKISRGEFKCPHWFSPQVRKLLSWILEPNPIQRITVAKLMENCWFRKGYKHIDIPPPSPQPCTLDSLITDHSSGSWEPRSPVRPSYFNAFDIISLSQGLNLSGLFEKDLNQRDCSRFTTRKPASDIVSKFEQIAQTESFSIKNKDGKVKLQGSKEGRKGQLGIDAEIFEVTPSFYVVELKKTAGDTLEYKNFCNKELKPSLKDIVWAWQGSNNYTQSLV